MREIDNNGEREEVKKKGKGVCDREIVRLYETWGKKNENKIRCSERYTILEYSQEICG